MSTKINSDTVALITGGASGIGKIMAKILLEKGAEVVIWDINDANITNTLNELSNIGRISAQKVDVSNAQEILDAAKHLKQSGTLVDILINNAGIVVGKYFHDHSQSDIAKTMDINATAPMLVAHAFLKDMLIRREGHICNIASSAGLISNPKMSVYAASKWAVVGWSDSVRLEMQQLKSNVKITTIMPYYINTGMFNGVKSRIPILEPEAVAKTIIKAIEKQKTMVTIPGYLYLLSRGGQALLPIKIFDFVADKIFGIYQTMAYFVGRK